MGWSCTKAAGDVLDRFETNIVNGVSNSWEHKGKKYFYETGRENDDGAITGEIWAFVEQRSCRRVAGFRIEPDGTVSRAPYGFAARLASSPVIPERDLRSRFTVPA